MATRRTAGTRTGWAAMGVALLAATLAAGQRDSQGRWVGVLDEHPAIEYSVRPTRTAIDALNARLASGEARLAFDPGSGYLASVLRELDVPAASQMLVLSRTGVQRAFTSPGNPRALYFNESVAVGYIRHAPFLEFIAHDPSQGAVFYTLDQRATDRPALSRQSGCITCHVATSTLEVPGFMTRSLTALADGTPSLRFGSETAIDHRTPFEQRWGGWFVTGRTGALRHRGNTVLDPGDVVRAVAPGGAFNVTTLDGVVGLDTYPAATSDVAALAVFDHQAHALNLLTRLGWESRVAAHEGRRALDAPSVMALLDDAVAYLTFADEAPLPGALASPSPFADWFAARGTKDADGRTLHALELRTRLFRYPLSYTIESPAFAALPDDVRGALLAGLTRALSAPAAGPGAARFPAADRRAALEILRAMR
ncbi:MAG: hypothetical protein U0P30_05285 [Vicinamibacterales bacterium]